MPCWRSAATKVIVFQWPCGTWPTTADFTEGKLLGHVADDEVLLVQVGSEIFGIDPSCSHYHGPLAEGVVVDGTIPLSLASCLFLVAKRRGDTTARA
jgi:hypothetical protein